MTKSNKVVFMFALTAAIFAVGCAEKKPEYVPGTASSQTNPVSGGTEKMPKDMAKRYEGYGAAQQSQSQNAKAGADAAQAAMDKK